MWLAYAFLIPTLLVVLAIVLSPLLANWWFSFKSIRLADLRPPTLFVNENLRGKLDEPGSTAVLEYRLRNSSRQIALKASSFSDTLPENLEITELDERCKLAEAVLSCELGELKPGHNERLKIPVTTTVGSVENPRNSEPLIVSSAVNVLTTFDFTLDNYRAVFGAEDFWEVLKVSIYYTVFGTIGALLLGLFAALMLNQAFAGRSVLRGLFLFPYVAPVIAVAFAWVILLDPFSGSFNAMLMQVGAIEKPINFFGSRYVELSFFGLAFDFPLALASVIGFEAWRYFPLSFLFILARMQSVSATLYEAAEMDGATPLQQFWSILLPQLAGILAVLFLLRFIWTFNKFDDIFLLTGGASGTRTFTVNVYEQAFALANLGTGAAVAVVIFVILLVFTIIFVKYTPKDEG